MQGADTDASTVGWSDKAIVCYFRTRVHFSHQVDFYEFKNSANFYFKKITGTIKMNIYF